MSKKIDKFPQNVTNYIGSFKSIIFHTIFFIGIFVLRFLGVSFSDVLLILTTIVSLEAIYLSIFIQISVNNHSKKLKEVSRDIEDIQENIEDIQAE